MTDAAPPRGSPLTAKMEYVGDDALVIHLVGRLDLPGLLQLRKVLRTVVIDRPWVLLDLAAVPEFHHGVLAVLSATQRRLRRHGSRLALWRLRAQPLQLVRDGRLIRGVEVVTGPVADWLAGQGTRRI